MRDVVAQRCTQHRISGVWPSVQLFGLRVTTIRLHAHRRMPIARQALWSAAACPRQPASRPLHPLLGLPCLHAGVPHLGGGHCLFSWELHTLSVDCLDQCVASPSTRCTAPCAARSQPSWQLFCAVLAQCTIAISVNFRCSGCRVASTLHTACCAQHRLLSGPVGSSIACRSRLPSLARTMKAYQTAS